MGSPTLKKHLCSLLILLFSASWVEAAVIDHQIEIQLDPASGRLQVRDQITLPTGVTAEFILHGALQVEILTPGATLSQLSSQEGELPLTHYRVSLPEKQRRFTLKYSGKIVHDFSQLQESPGRSRQQMRGTISEGGVFLDNGVAWYPLFGDQLQTFSLQVELPDGWLAVSQGDGPETNAERQIRWQASQPQDDIYLIAAPFQLYREQSQGVEAQVYLRQPNAALAQRYLEATHRYLALYSELLGPYPYRKFALVENFWESGYGMPSFTLLGPRVIRLPFIIHTSYPHEILHNWWGNGVYVEYAGGNWSEGLTSYLADHALKELHGKGAEYRRAGLLRYADFVRSGNDFPLSQFRSRHSGASQAVGYDKSLMLFHMLRRSLGDHSFIEGLRRFYTDNRFKQAGYQELKQAFESVSKRDLGEFFEQWTDRTGAPRLELRDLQLSSQKNGGYLLQGKVVQTQPEPLFILEAPILTHFADGGSRRTRLLMKQREQAFELKLRQPPVQVDLDPWYDLFRQILPGEAPQTLSKLFGSEEALIVLPANAPQSLKSAYRQLAQQWAVGYPGIEIIADEQLTALPKDRPVWLLGWNNRFLPQLKALLPAGQAQLSDNTIRLQSERLPRAGSSLALACATPQGGTIGWVASDNSKALAGLARKLPHYGRYSFVGFTGSTPDNHLKGQWQVTDSPLTVMLDPDAAVHHTAGPPALLGRLKNRPTK
ncbi:Peptidase MA superfamily [endosymbiont of Ridgeia piscesae]|jgi:hypothetical protein|uniref:Peptidase MA superfamily n=1 Tax=endosymbiont of Ridgeia piscesae TaxID=54398 RepID=A0A0T5YWH0_9GAMM|nr:Peptidase MA superfamily [endosymbiont of Ridgeia piscesae]KRT59440.1 hypothetical protein Ga0076813_15464 [endosymbiont of Ridgeia piscesae]